MLPAPEHRALRKQFSVIYGHSIVTLRLVLNGEPHYYDDVGRYQSPVTTPDLTGSGLALRLPEEEHAAFIIVECEFGTCIALVRLITDTGPSGGRTADARPLDWLVT